MQSFKLGTTIVSEALTISEVVELLDGRDLNWNTRPRGVGGTKVNYSLSERGAL